MKTKIRYKQKRNSPLFIKEGSNFTVAYQQNKKETFKQAGKTLINLKAASVWA